jgi:catechol 2,3-dioxygenase-like lactoylglutathione lyase family enzyme
MEQLIAKLIQDFEEGKTSRRQLIRTLAVAASAASVVGVTEAVAADAAPLKAVAINHISYQVADYAKTRDFYSGLLGMKVSADNGKQCNLALGGINIIARNGMGPTPNVDHIAYSIDNWSDDAVLAELKRRGLDPKPEGMNSFQIKDPDGYHAQLSAKPKA